MYVVTFRDESVYISLIFETHKITILSDLITIRKNHPYIIDSEVEIRGSIRKFIKVKYALRQLKCKLLQGQCRIYFIFDF